MSTSSSLDSRNWLVSRKFDLWVFGAPALLALLLMGLESQLAPTGELGLGAWVLMILVADVAHVWSTIYRTYLDREELRRRPRLYIGAPVFCYLFGFFAYSISMSFFWTVLAYAAVFHFVRQQYGWVALYNRRAGDEGRLDQGLDQLVIYASTIFPLLWWHAHLPRKFTWFLPGDFIVGLSAEWVAYLWPIYGLVFVLYIGRQWVRWRRAAVFRAGKNLIVLSTALCWGLGIIATNSDWSFTASNVLIHGLPYLAIVWVYGRRADYAASPFLRGVFEKRRWLVFLGIVIALAYMEEWAWDRFIWHEQGDLFLFPAVELSVELQTLLVPLLALPQATHYLLDAWIWKTKKTENPQLARAMSLSLSSE